MSIVTQIFDEIQGLENTFEIHCKRMSKATAIAIWGTGIAGKLVGEFCLKNKMNLICFIDSYKERTGRIFCGRPVLHKDEFYAKYQDVLVVIACNVQYGIDKQLRERQYTNFFCIEPMFTIRNFHSYKDAVWNNRDKVEQVYQLLADSKSKLVFKNIIKHRLICDLKLVQEVYDPNQYFDNDLIAGGLNGVFVDCGAYTGDTLKRFMSFSNGDFKAYYALEPDVQNFQALEALVSKQHWEQVRPVNVGVWNEKCVLKFNGGEGVSARTDESGRDSIQAECIDHIVGQEKVDIITMDVEGAEQRALLGAKKTIQTHQPILAISCYHSVEDLWEIPLQIKQICPEYRLYFRHHMWNMDDTVCYAIAERAADQV